MAMIHADRFRWEQDVLANLQLTAAQKIVLTTIRSDFEFLVDWEDR